MKKQEMINIISEIICEKQGCKGTELASDKRFALADYDGKLDLIDEMVREKIIVEVSYSIPNMSYRKKSFYLPGGSRIDVKELYH